MTDIKILGEGTNQLTFVGIPYSTYYIQWASNLLRSPWFGLSTNTADMNGIWQVIDDQATNPMRFYRSVWP